MTLTTDLESRAVDELHPGDRIAISMRNAATVLRVEPIPEQARIGIARPATHRIILDDGERSILASAGQRFRLATTAVEAEWVNRSAQFLPQRTDDDRPAIRIGGALVLAYFDDDGELTVNIVTEDVEQFGGPEAVRIRVAVNDADLLAGTPGGGLGPVTA
jgi:hypothetical protein